VRSPLNKHREPEPRQKQASDRLFVLLFVGPVRLVCKETDEAVRIAPVLLQCLGSEAEVHPTRGIFTARVGSSRMFAPRVGSAKVPP
jgi:hypothetical protein